ncbi:hypothetical protein PV327_010856 [Microctonus hyperodae]|uniref:Uncharacterized protein n=1 Tax=Microctonus hyperodae TaxID=165561 RepID=A0AA39F0E6_MICHY|nr:hypothetical protein PV327_010856 [Microctonus hyperodae]
MQRQSLICLFNLIVVATAAGVYGGVNIDPNSAAAQAGVTFPRIPGLNSPLFGFSLFPPRNGPSGFSGLGGPGSFGPPSNGQLTLPPLPNVTDLVPELPNAENASSIFIPRINGPPPLSSLPRIPGLSDALQDARNHVETALSIGPNFVNGIQKALEQAFQTNDPTGAVRTLVNTILDAYLTVAENCPMIVIGVRVLQEGIRLAGEVAKSARNVILGPS